MEVPVLVDIASAVADALDAAHTHGHRASRHQAGEHLPYPRGPKILDFGLAKATLQPAADSSMQPTSQARR
jgi:hypothetical protein